jgi:hypothetical protein
MLTSKPTSMGVDRGPPPPARVDDAARQQRRDEPHRAHVPDLAGRTDGLPYPRHEPLCGVPTRSASGSITTTNSSSGTPSRTSRPRTNRRVPDRASDDDASAPPSRNNGPSRNSASTTPGAPTSQALSCEVVRGGSRARVLRARRRERPRRRPPEVRRLRSWRRGSHHGRSGRGQPRPGPAGHHWRPRAAVGPPALDLRIASADRGRGNGAAALREVRLGKEAHYRRGWPTRDGRLLDAVGYALVRTDWRDGTTTPVAWNGLEQRTRHPRRHGRGFAHGRDANVVGGPRTAPPTSTPSGPGGPLLRGGRGRPGCG